MGLIEADALKKMLRTDKGADILGHSVGRLLKADALIDEMPTVDAVSVVRCEVCKHWCRNAGIADSPNGHGFCHDIETNEQDFCSCGERRSDAI